MPLGWRPTGEIEREGAAEEEVDEDMVVYWWWWSSSSWKGREREDGEGEKKGEERGRRWSGVRVRPQRAGLHTRLPFVGLARRCCHVIPIPDEAGKGRLDSLGFIKVGASRWGSGQTWVRSNDTSRDTRSTARPDSSAEVRAWKLRIATRATAAGEQVAWRQQRRR